MAHILNRILLCINNKSQVIRHLSTSCVRLNTPLSIPPSTLEPEIVSPKIESLGVSICNLTLIEVSELNSFLKKKLNLPEFPTTFAIPSNDTSVSVEEEVIPSVVKSSYTVKLIKYDESKKIGVIKEIKNLLQDMNLVQAKKFVESAPTIIKSDVNKEEADKLKNVLEKVGAEIIVE